MYRVDTPHAVHKVRFLEYMSMEEITVREAEAYAEGKTIEEKKGRIKQGRTTSIVRKGGMVW